MALPPLPDNNTARLWVQYNSGTGIHEMMFRRVTSVTKADFIFQVREFCTALVSLMRNTGGWSAARYSEQGSDISLPETWSLIAGTSTTAPGAGTRAGYYTFTGRSLNGRKARLFFYTPYYIPEDDWRREVGDITVLDNARAVLQAPAAKIAAIDGSVPVWYPYYNVGVNAYWQRRSRVIGTP